MTQYPEQIEIVDIDEVLIDPDNANEHPDANIVAIRDSLRKFGQRTPVVVDSQGIVLKGNGTVQAARLEGWTEIAIVRSDLTGLEATAYAIMDNRASELSKWDNRKLGVSMRAIADSDESLLQFTGFSEAGRQKLMANIDPNMPDEFPEVDETIHTDYKCPKCAYEWSGGARTTTRREADVRSDSESDT